MAGESAPIPGNQSEFGERYEVITASPLPEFSTSGGEAFKAIDKKNTSVDIYALVQYPTVPVRNEVYKSFVERPLVNMVNPLERGLMNVDLGGGKQRLVTIFRRPTGGALMGEDGMVHPRLNANKLRQNVTLSVLKALAALHKRGNTHRMIFPTRMYFASEDTDEIVIGECYSAPAGYNNPFGLEALELAFADDVARGEGDASSDFFQLGAALQALYFGEKLWEGRDRDSLTMARINQGSYWALSGGQEIPGTMGTLIKGLMADEVEERWGAEDVLDWFEGVGKNKRTSMKSWTMSRPTSFKGVSYVDRRLLAYAFGKDPKEAAEFLKRMDFPSWVQQNFRNEIFSERLEKALGVKPSEGYSGPRADDYKMVARVCLFLYPTGPIFYKGHAFYVSAVPGWFADCFARDDRESLSTILDVFESRFITVAADIVGEKNNKFQAEMSAYFPALEHGSSKQLGRGLERSLYELNPILPCVSTRFSDIWIGSLAQMMRALDRLAGAGGGKNVLLDRHIAAYCVAHGNGFERDFNNLAAAQGYPAKFNALAAEFFGHLQVRLKLGPLKHLTEKVVEGLAPSVKALKNKKRREQVQAALEKLKKGGDISKLITDLNMIQVQALDAREFAQASNLVKRLEMEKVRLSKKILATDIEPRRRGYRGAKIVALAMMFLIGFLSFYKG